MLPDRKATPPDREGDDNAHAASIRCDLCDCTRGARTERVWLYGQNSHGETMGARERPLETA